MANSRLSVKLTAVNLVIGLLIVLLSLALFSWLLPMLLGPTATLTLAGAVVGVFVWFLFMLSRQGAE
jgi:hypothetical protein